MIKEVEFINDKKVFIRIIIYKCIKIINFLQVIYKKLHENVLPKHHSS